jgi:antirestriction protein ArdC
MKTKDVYQIVTDRIVEQLETGVNPWAKPWAEGAAISRPLRFNGQPYRGINVLILWWSALCRGYENPTWMTYNQAKALGGQVRKGENSEMVVYYTKIKIQDKATGEEKSIPLLRNFSVFNVAQIDNLPAKYSAKIEHEYERNPKDRIPHVDAFFENTGAKVHHHGSRAFYSPTNDDITLPELTKFKDAESYYSTRGHETVHWTRHETRLNRTFGYERWGDEGYAMEELVAEIGAAFLCADLGIALAPRDDHAQYIAHWLKVLKNDKKAIFTAASAAEKASTFLHDLQPNKVSNDNAEDEVGGDLTEAA